MTWLLQALAAALVLRRITLAAVGVQVTDLLEVN
jgi:hypothetical protein